MNNKGEESAIKKIIFLILNTAESNDKEKIWEYSKIWIENDKNTIVLGYS
jgi:hypothetical protein